jgi:hypothetical protein
MAAGSTYTPIATTTLGSAAASYTFTGISGSYTDLRVVISTATSKTSQSGFGIQVGNGSIDTGSNYSVTRLGGNGSVAYSERTSSQTSVAMAMQTTLSNFFIDFMSYSNTTTYKTFLITDDNASAQTLRAVGLWRSTSAINQVKIFDTDGFNLIAGSTLTLYGIAAA